jgi:hypothetical protein
LLFCFFVFCETPGANAGLYKGKTYYVSLSGENTASGTQKSPWRSIQHAADVVSHGDRIFILSGTYNEHVKIHISGKENFPIIFSAVPGEKVTVKSLEISKGVSHVNIVNFKVEGFKFWGVSLEGSNHHVQLSGLTVKGGEAGVHFTSGDSGSSPQHGPVSDIIVENTLVQNSQYTAIDCTPGPCDRMIFRQLEVTGAGGRGENNWGADGLAIERGQHIIVENCYIHDNSGDGIDLNSRDITGNVSGVVVKRNQVVRNHRNGIKLWAGGRMEHNIIWGQGDTAVVLGDWPGEYKVINNTIAFNMWDPKYSDRNYALLAAYPNDENGVSANMQLTLRNNIFAFNTSEAVGGSTGIYLGKGVRLVSEGNNLYWSQVDNEILAEFVAAEREFSRAQVADGTWATVTGQGKGDITADPLFIAGWPKVDVRLRSDSPANVINVGASPEVLSAGLKKGEIKKY